MFKKKTLADCADVNSYVHNVNFFFFVDAGPMVSDHHHRSDLLLIFSQ